MAVIPRAKQTPDVNMPWITGWILCKLLLVADLL